MKLVYKSDYLSITKFSPVEIPDFTVLTGVNGSGKSHLLAAIEKNNVITEGVSNPRIVHFNYETFKLENEAQTNAQQILAERTAAWNFFLQPRKTNIKGSLQNFKNTLGNEYGILTKISLEKEKPLWKLSKADVENDALFEKLKQYKQSISDLFSSNPHLKDNTQASAIFVMAKKSQEGLDEMSEAEFCEQFEPYQLKNDFLPTQLGKFFADYFSRYELNQYNKFRNSDYHEKHAVLSETAFSERYGPKPWNVVNEILKTFSSLPYSINSPEGLTRNDGFQIKLIHDEKPNVSPAFSELSSGERILMALVASIFKSKSDAHFPDILLLDEIDASLHPSMMKNLLEVIQNIFLQNGVKVVLVTHSPTTIALAPEESIFVVNRSGENRIVKKTQSEALEILTEGFATLEKGIQLLDQISKADMTILTEGRNIAYIEKVLQFHNITDVEVIKGAEDRTGKQQLKVLYDFFSVLPHERSVIIVWDCDATTYTTLPVVNKTAPFVFVKNEDNGIYKKGIENLFSEDRFNGFTKSITTSFGDTTIEFDGARKADFEQSIMDRNEPSDFTLFQPLIDMIVEIRKT